MGGGQRSATSNKKVAPASQKLWRKFKLETRVGRPVAPVLLVCSTFVLWVVWSETPFCTLAVFPLEKMFSDTSIDIGSRLPESLDDAAKERTQHVRRHQNHELGVFDVFMGERSSCWEAPNKTRLGQTLSYSREWEWAGGANRCFRGACAPTPPRASETCAGAHRVWSGGQAVVGLRQFLLTTIEHKDMLGAKLRRTLKRIRGQA